MQRKGALSPVAACARCREYGTVTFVNGDNAVGTAIERLGGLTEATVKTGVASSTWVRWRLKGYIEDAHVLLQTARLTGLRPEALAKPSRRRA